MAARRWCFTLNSYTDEDEKEIAQWCQSTDRKGDKNVKYLIYGREVGAAGNKHLQGFLILNKPGRFPKVRTGLSAEGKAHIEKCKGTTKQNITYCKKEGDVTVFGEEPQQGKRGDLDEYREMAKEHGMRRVVESANLQQIRVAEKYLTYNEPSRDFKPKVIWIYGKSGSGKSRRARQIISLTDAADDIYTKNIGTKWWDGYDGHKAVILDDFRPSWWRMVYMLGLIDRYAFQVEVKGGNRQMRAKIIVITSIRPPSEMYKVGEDKDEPNEQLLRRIDDIFNQDEA